MIQFSLLPLLIVLGYALILGFGIGPQAQPFPMRIIPMGSIGPRTIFLEIMQCTQTKFLSLILISLVFTFDCKIKKKLNQHRNSLDSIHRSGFNENELTYIQPHDEFLSPILISLVFTFDCKIKKKLNQHSNSLDPIHRSGFNENELTYIQPHDEFLSPILISLVFTFDCKIKKKLN